jgi:hypothetical protein
MWLHLLFLAIATFLTWVWTTNPQLSFYTLQLIAGLILVYFFKNLKKPKASYRQYDKVNKSLDALILTMVILLLVFSTGGLNSPLFFLVYFLLFGISFLFEPPLSIGLSLILIVFFLTEVKSANQLVQLVSLVFVAPLAWFFGQQYLQNLTAQKRAKFFQKKWLDNEKSLELGETNVLIWLSLNFRNTLAEILEITALFLSDLSHLTPQQQSWVKKIREKANQLISEGEKLHQQIDEQTDEK